MLVAPAYVLLMLVGGLHFGLIGTPLGLVLFLAMVGFLDGTPLRYFDLGADGWFFASWFAVVYGGPPAFLTGLAAVPMRLHLPSHGRFVLLMAPVGALATAAYLALFSFLRNEERTFTLTVVAGALAAVLCALPFGFWLGRKSPT